VAVRLRGLVTTWGAGEQRLWCQSVRVVVLESNDCGVRE
jgi:hypothetical protein